MRISDWSSDVCSSDLTIPLKLLRKSSQTWRCGWFERSLISYFQRHGLSQSHRLSPKLALRKRKQLGISSIVEQRSSRSCWNEANGTARSEEHASELPLLMRISYAVFCWKKHMTD